MYSFLAPWAPLFCRKINTDLDDRPTPHSPQRTCLGSLSSPPSLSFNNHDRSPNALQHTISNTSHVSSKYAETASQHFRLESKDLTPRSPRRGGSRFGDTSSQSVSRDEFDKSGVYLRIYVICYVCTVYYLTQPL